MTLHGNSIYEAFVSDKQLTAGITTNGLARLARCKESVHEEVSVYAVVAKHRIVRRKVSRKVDIRSMWSKLG